MISKQAVIDILGVEFFISIKREEAIHEALCHHLLCVTIQPLSSIQIFLRSILGVLPGDFAAAVCLEEEGAIIASCCLLLIPN